MPTGSTIESENGSTATPRLPSARTRLSWKNPKYLNVKSSPRLVNRLKPSSSRAPLRAALERESAEVVHDRGQRDQREKPPVPEPVEDVAGNQQDAVLCAVSTAECEVDPVDQDEEGDEDEAGERHSDAVE